jgi:anaerobic selenocysteine-containing dehydrogenase
VLDELPTYREPEERPDRKGKYPLYILTPNTKNRIHSQFGMLESIRRMAPEPFVSMHPKRRASKGPDRTRHGARLQRPGELRLPVKLDWGLKPGCISITNGFWITEGAAVNVLSKGRETDMGYGAAFHDNAVEVERA